PELAARRRPRDDDAPRRDAPLPRPALGGGPLHPPERPAQLVLRALVARLRRPPDRLRAPLPRGALGHLGPPPRAAALAPHARGGPAAAGRAPARGRPPPAPGRGRPGARGPRPPEALRLPRGRRRGRPRPPPGGAPQPHRPERRRQDDLLQHADGPRARR